MSKIIFKFNLTYRDSQKDYRDLKAEKLGFRGMQLTDQKIDGSEPAEFLNLTRNSL